jgi:hypothetical protein
MNLLLSYTNEISEDFFVNDKNKKSLIKNKSLKDYQPFIKVSDISSLGRSHRVFGHKTKRTHHLLSDLELAVFLLFEWHDNTEDIQEQFPLDINVTEQIADSLGIRHPSQKGELKTMSTDFYVISKDIRSITSQLALQAKYSKDLDDARTIEKLELERRYWEQKDVDFKIITEKNIPRAVTDNIKWLYPSKNAYLTTVEENDFIFYSEQMVKSPTLKIIDFCKKIDSAYDYPLGKALSQLKNLIAHGYISFDIRKDYRKIICAELSIVDRVHLNYIDKELKRASNQ